MAFSTRADDVGNGAGRLTRLVGQSAVRHARTGQFRATERAPVPETLFRRAERAESALVAVGYDADRYRAIWARTEIAIRQTEGKRLSYKQPIAKPDVPD
jgi:hypothetical protein